MNFYKFRAIQNILKSSPLNYGNEYLPFLILYILWFVDAPLKSQTLMYHFSGI